MQNDFHKEEKTVYHVSDVISICQNSTLILNKNSQKTRNRLELSQSYEEHYKT